MAPTGQLATPTFYLRDPSPNIHRIEVIQKDVLIHIFFCRFLGNLVKHYIWLETWLLWERLLKMQHLGYIPQYWSHKLQQPGQKKISDKGIKRLKHMRSQITNTWDIKLWYNSTVKWDNKCISSSKRTSCPSLKLSSPNLRLSIHIINHHYIHSSADGDNFSVCVCVCGYEWMWGKEKVYG